MPSGAREAAMAGAFTAIADDASSVFSNPAGAALAPRHELALSHAEWLQGLKAENLAYVHALDAGRTVGAGLTMLRSGSMQGYDSAGGETASFSSNEGAASFAYAQGLGGGFHAGAAAKGIWQRVAGEQATAWALDAGLVKTWEEFRLGIAVQNLGTKLKLYSEAFSLPTAFRAGGAWRVKDRAWVSLEAAQSREGGLAAALGVEGELRLTETEAILPRFGYRSGRSEGAGIGVTAGLGLRVRVFQVDYAFSPYGDLGNTHRLSFGLRFGPVRGGETVRSYPADVPRIKPRANGKARANGRGKAEPKPKKWNEPTYLMVD
jgi:hypothetical protein